MSEQSALQRFCKYVDREDTDDVEIVYRVRGGIPDESQAPVEKERLREVRLFGNGTVDVSMTTQQFSGKLDRAQVQELFEKIRSGVDSLDPMSEARFPFDSQLGSITIDVDGKKVVLFFLLSERERVALEKPIAPDVVEVVKRFEEIAQHLENQDEET